MSSTRWQYGCSVMPGPSVIEYPQNSNSKCASSATINSNITSAFSPEKFSENDNGVGTTRQSEILYSILVKQRDQGTSSYGSVLEQPSRTETHHQIMNGRCDIDVTGREKSSDVFRHDNYYGAPMDIKSANQSNQSYNARNLYASSVIKEQTDKLNDSSTWCENSYISRTPSRDSIFSHDGSSSTADDRKYQAHLGSGGKVTEGGTRLGGEDSVELAMNQLVYLSTDSGRNSNSNSPTAAGSGLFEATPYRATSTKSLSLPSTPPSPPLPEMRRKNSMGNHDLKRVWQTSTYVGRSGDQDPVDLSCKRKCSEGTVNQPSFSCDAERKSSDPGSMEPPNSILRAALRGRSATFSSLPVASKYSTILETALRGRSSTFSGVRPTISLDKYRNMSRSAAGSNDSLSSLPRAHVQLAKRNLNPVKSRILDRLNAMTSFALNLPEFIALPIKDQRTLLVGAAHRLLFLFMAESNLEFVVTTIHCEELTPVSTPTSDTNGDLDEKFPGKHQEEKIELEPSSKASKVSNGRFEAPTKQFVEGVQNFISKCQAINIRPSEYFYMRWIVLFHADKSRLERHDVVANLNTSARQDLQEIVTDSHPEEKLRYSKLLLALHTVFGLNCNMLDALFCAPLGLKGGVEAFICDSLDSNQSAL